jgi:hypothetical protein
MSATPRLSTSTWSLHRTIGITYPDSPSKRGDGKAVATYGSGALTLLEIPAHLASRGIHTLEICHFHLPYRDRAYLEDLRSALETAGVELFSLLIDDGDQTHPEHGARDLEWIGEWIDVAGKLGAKRVRVIAGKTVSSEALERSHDGFRALLPRAKAHNIRVMTENWFNLLSSPQAVDTLLTSLDGEVGLCVDFGNWSGDSKYRDLEAIMRFGESCHAKCAFAAPQIPNADDYNHCLAISQAAGFSGPYTLIYDGPGDDEWRGLTLESQMVAPYLSAN